MRVLLSRSALLLLAASACGRAPVVPTRATVPSTRLEWPKGDAPAAFRLALVIENRAPGEAGGSVFHRVLSAIAGADSEPAPDGFQRPFGVAPLASGGFVVADPDAARVFRFGPGGAFDGDVACPGRAWAAPLGAGETPTGALLVVDGAGELVRWSRAGCAKLPVPLARPTGIAVSPSMAVVADPGAFEVVVLTPEGTETGRWKGGDAGHGFDQPTAVAIGGDGSVFVVDGIRSRVVRLSPDGRWQEEFDDARLARAKGIHVDVANRVLVSDAERDEIVVFGADSSFLYTIGASGSGPGEFAHPAGLGGAGKRVLVADSLNRRVQVLESTGANP